MPRALDQHFLGMLAGAGAVGVEPLDHQIEGRGADDIEIPVDAGRAPHFVGRAVKISEADIVRHAHAPFPRAGCAREICKRAANRAHCDKASH